MSIKDRKPIYVSAIPENGRFISQYNRDVSEKALCEHIDPEKNIRITDDTGYTPTDVLVKRYLSGEIVSGSRPDHYSYDFDDKATEKDYNDSVIDPTHDDDSDQFDLVDSLRDLDSKLQRVIKDESSKKARKSEVKRSENVAPSTPSTEVSND